MTHKNKSTERFTGNDKVKPHSYTILSLNVTCQHLTFGGKSQHIALKPHNHLVVLSSYVGVSNLSLLLDSTFLASNCLPAFATVIMGLHRGNSRALDSSCAIVIRKSGLILPYSSPT